MKEQVVDDQLTLLSMMTKPRKTLRFALEHKNFSHSLYIGAVGGFSNALLGQFQTKYPKGYFLGDLVYSSFISGIIVYLISCFVTGFILKHVGRWFGSQATFKQLFQTLCLVAIPYIWLLPILLFWMQLSPETFFKVDLLNLEMKQLFVMAFGALAIIIASIWAFILTLVGLSEAMRISKWKAFGAMIIATFIVGVVMLLFMSVL